MLRYKKDFHFIGGFAPDASMDRSDIFHRIDSFVTSSRWVIIAGDWNVVLDPNLDRSIRMVQTFLRLQFIFFVVILTAYLSWSINSELII